MLHKMSEVRGWSHNDMMNMDQPIFFRYYGYWLASQLEEEANYTRDKEREKANNRK